MIIIVQHLFESKGIGIGPLAASIHTFISLAIGAHLVRLQFQETL